MRKKTLAVTLIAGINLLALDGCLPPQPKSGDMLPSRAPHAPVPPKPRPVPLDAQLRADAKGEIIAAFNNADAQLRGEAVEAAQQTLGSGAHAIVEAALRDNAASVRFAGCIAAGLLRLKDLHDDVLGLAFDGDRKVQLAGRFALHRLGDTHLSRDFEKTARDPNPRVREDTAFFLGLTEDKTALRLLNDMSHDSDLYVRQAVAEAQWRLGDSSGLESLVGGVSSNEIQLRLFSMVGLAATHDRRVAGNLQGQLTPVGSDAVPEVNLVAARCLGDVGTDDGYLVAMRYLKDKDPQLRLLAAAALGSIGRSDAQDALRPLLHDEDARVRLTSATSILKLKPPA